MDGGDSHDMINTLNVVFAIHSKVEVSVTIHYQNLCLMLGKALRHEEKRYSIFVILLSGPVPPVPVIVSVMVFFFCFSNYHE